MVRCGTDRLAVAIYEAARATTLDELATVAFPALARALDACPSFFARSADVFVESEALAGEARAELPGYLREFITDDPLIGAVVADARVVNVLERNVERRAIQRSRAYHEFHRPHDMEHHLLVRLLGDRITTAGALSMGFTRGRRQRAFDAGDARTAELVLPALRGSAQRILRARARPALEHAAARVAAEHGLTAAEHRVLGVLVLGASNQQIARALSVSIETVKTHLQRIYRRLGVSSRAQAIAAVRI